MIAQKIRDYFVLGLAISLYAIIFFGLERSQTLSLFLAFFTLFGLFLYYGFRLKNKYSTSTIFWVGLGFRLIPLLAVPSLSDDYFRFIWDGNLLLKGINPFRYLPSELINSDGFDSLKELYTGMNSPEYYSVYPPVLQWVFGLAAVIAGPSILGNLVIFRLVLIAAEVLSFKLLVRLSPMLNLPVSIAFWYFLNPLVVIEIVGNIHFEGLLIPGILLMVLGLKANNFKNSMVGFLGGVGAKLLPLYFIPFLLFSTPKRHWFKWIGFSAIGFAVMCLPFFYSLELIQNFLTSVKLYFKTFEFNPGIYGLIKHLGSAWVGYNPIHIVGPILGVLVWVVAIVVSYFKRNTPEKVMFWVLLTHVGLASIVHPWYIIPVLLTGILNGYFFPVLWGGLVFLSYHAYTVEGVVEHQWVIALEYLLVFLFMLFEIIRHKKAPEKPRLIF